jgi:hypothetical protein
MVTSKKEHDMNVLGMFSTKTEEPKTTVKIDQIGSRYTIQIGDQRLYILNEKSLIWNLKHMGMKRPCIDEAFEFLNTGGYVEFELEDVA